VKRERKLAWGPKTTINNIWVVHHSSKLAPCKQWLGWVLGSRFLWLGGPQLVGGGVFCEREPVNSENQSWLFEEYKKPIPLCGLLCPSESLTSCLGGEEEGWGWVG
jgi:hypothetical protein